MSWDPSLHPRGYAWAENKHRRWPAGTPGGLGGKWMDMKSASKLSKMTGVPAADLLKNPAKAVPGHAARKGEVPRPTGPSLPPIKDPGSAGAIDVHGDVRLAAKYLSEGQAVQLSQPREVSILLDHLAMLVKDAEARGDKAPNYDLCKVTIKGQSLFCVESMGIQRIHMPQLKAVPEPGTPAAKRKADDKGEVDLTNDFVKMLESRGYKSEDAEEHVAYLRPTQNELNGKKVAGMVKWMRGGGNPNPQRKGGPAREIGLIVSRDNYILDGHHRWAATVGIDSEDNILGNDKKIPITRIDIDTITLVKLAMEFAKEQGIAPADVTQQAPVAKA